MKTEHPIYKAYKDGELLSSQPNAVNFDAKGVCIDPEYTDDLRMLVPSAETSDGEPIYEGDILYTKNMKEYEVCFCNETLHWEVLCLMEKFSHRMYLCHLLRTYATVTHKKPKPERRKGERREDLPCISGRRSVLASDETVFMDRRTP